MIKDLQNITLSHPKYQWHHEKLLRGEKLVIGPHQKELQPTIMRRLHSSPQGGHLVKRQLFKGFIVCSTRRK